MARRAFTLIEVLFVSLLTVIILGTVVGIYGYAARRSVNAMNETAALLQAQMMMDRIEKVIQNSVTCRVVVSNGNAGLRCTMPNSGTDKDSDGVFDVVNPNGVSRRQIATYGLGKRVWFYASATGALSTSGSRYYMATRNDDNVPTSIDVRPTFGFAPGSVYRWSLIDSVTFTVDPNNEYVTVTIRASTRAGSERALGSSTAESSDNYVVTLTRNIAWRCYWR